MAHLKKNTRGSVKGLSTHFERKTDNHSNEEIEEELVDEEDTPLE